VYKEVERDGNKCQSIKRRCEKCERRKENYKGGRNDWLSWRNIKFGCSVEG
jgi:hypothetical protein